MIFSLGTQRECGIVAMFHCIGKVLLGYNSLE
jgi:hypothetical protein